MLPSGQLQFIPAYLFGASPDYWHIERYNGVDQWKPVDYLSSGLSNSVFNQVYDPASGKVLVEAIDHESSSQVFNSNVFDLGDDLEYPYIIFTPYHITPNPNTLDPGNNTLTAHIKPPSELITFKPGDDEECYNFNNMNVWKIHDIEGFCGFINGGISIAQPVPAGFDPSFSTTFDFNNSFSLEEPLTHCDDCIIATAPASNPDPVPCGCVKYTLEIRIEPCTEAPPGCEALEFTEEIQVCCRCDVREEFPND
ncbi:MAG: hypothetical protein ACI9NN_001093 [Bacteroidia bacterium]|jgi:hypothetical protein